MKYNAKQLSNGKWAVFAGKQYWPSTVSETKEEAHIWAIKKSAIWHRDQLDKLSEEFGIVEEGTLFDWIC
jgi:hypothetical protein